MNRRYAFTAIVFAVSVVTCLGLASSARAANAPTAPGQADCGDMAGPVWHVLPVGERKGATGSHYTVTAVNLPCTKARALTAKLIRLPAPKRGFTTILAGYTCLNTNAPAGVRFFLGGCVMGASRIPVPGSSAFNWHPCQFILASGKHPTCSWKYFAP